MFCNRTYLRDIRTAVHPTTIYCNAGSTVSTGDGIFTTELSGDIPVKYNPEGTCNNVSFKTVKKLSPITYKRDLGDGGGATFKVHTKKEVAYFKPCMKGLHNIYLKQHKTLYVQTMQGNLQGSRNK